MKLHCEFKRSAFENSIRERRSPDLNRDSAWSRAVDRVVTLRRASGHREDLRQIVGHRRPRAATDEQTLRDNDLRSRNTEKDEIRWNDAISHGKVCSRAGRQRADEHVRRVGRLVRGIQTALRADGHLRSERAKVGSCAGRSELLQDSKEIAPEIVS